VAGNDNNFNKSPAVCGRILLPPTQLSNCTARHMWVLYTCGHVCFRFYDRRECRRSRSKSLRTGWRVSTVHLPFTVQRWHARPDSQS